MVGKATMFSVLFSFIAIGQTVCVRSAVPHCLELGKFLGWSPLFWFQDLYLIDRVSRGVSFLFCLFEKDLMVTIFWILGVKSFDWLLQ